MRLLPRHYILIAIIIAFGIYNIARYLHPHARPQVTQPVSVVPTGPRPDSPAWSAFDHTASLRDAPDPTFQPALKLFDTQVNATTNPATLADLHGCRTWLVFYRQGVLHPSADTAWHTRSNGHLDSCVKYHQDVAS